MRLKGVADGNQVNIPEPRIMTKVKSCICLLDCICSEYFPGNNYSNNDRTKTGTGGRIEYIKALERTMLKELGKMHL